MLCNIITKRATGFKDGVLTVQQVQTFYKGRWQGQEFRASLRPLDYSFSVMLRAQKLSAPPGENQILQGVEQAVLEAPALL